MSIPDSPHQPSMPKLVAITTVLLDTAAAADLPQPHQVTISDSACICLQFPAGTDSVTTTLSWGSAISAKVHNDRSHVDDGPGTSALVKFIFDSV